MRRASVPAADTLGRVTRVLVAGLPRSGTSWVCRAIGRARGAVFVHEPDGDHEAFAVRAKRGYGRHIALEPGDAAPDYERLWAGAFAGGDRLPNLRARVAERLFETAPLRDRSAARRGEPTSWRLRTALALSVPPGPVAAEHVVAKSVHAALAIEWIDAHFAPAIVVVERDPRNVIASWLEHGIGGDRAENAQLAQTAQRRWGIGAPPADAPKIVQRTFVFGVLATSLREAAHRHPEWLVVSHDELCIDPRRSFRAVVARLGIEWDAAIDDYLDASNVDGAGFRTKRATAEQPDNWRTRLAADDVARLTDELARFPHELSGTPSD